MPGLGYMPLPLPRDNSCRSGHGARKNGRRGWEGTRVSSGAVQPPPPRMRNLEIMKANTQRVENAPQVCLTDGDEKLSEGE